MRCVGVRLLRLRRVRGVWMDLEVGLMLSHALRGEGGVEVTLSCVAGSLLTCLCQQRVHVE